MSDPHRLVEIVHPDFEFYHKEKPTGHYLRGLVIESLPLHGQLRVKSFSSKHVHTIHKKYVVFLDEQKKE